MNEKLHEAYQRFHAKQEAVAALAGQRRFKQKRYMEICDSQRIYWLPDKPGMVAVPDNFLRFVGRVEAESYGSYDCFTRGGRFPGWFTNDRGESWKDGDGLVCGVVYQLPTRRRHMVQFVAGYQYGGGDFGSVLDFSRIFTGQNEPGSPQEQTAAREAARWADDLAEEAAEEACEYDREEREREEALEA